MRRKLLYQWRDTVRRGGVEALRGVGRPPPASALVAAAARPRAAVAAGGGGARRAGAGAGQRIAALERKIGQQALELDFFGQALQLMKQAGRRPSGPPDAPASTASSGRGRSGKAG